MKKFVFLLLMVFVSAVSFAQVRAKVVLGNQPPQHRHYVHHRHHVVYHRRYHRRGTRVVVRGKL